MGATVIPVLLSSRNRTVVDNNTIGHFVTRFPKPLELDRDWEVALWEMWYPKTWWTVPHEEAFFLTIQGMEIHLPAGYYSDPLQVVNYLNKELDKRGKNGKLRFLGNRNRVEVVSGSMTFSPMLSSMLGFDPAREQRGVGQWEADLHNGVHHLYVYSDVVADGPVGDTVAPLLRASRIRASDPFGSMAYIRLRQPFFLPLKRGFVDSVEILVTDELGREVDFKEGSVLLTLLFRKHG